MDKALNDPQYIADVSCGHWWGSKSQSIRITDFPVTLTYQNCAQKSAEMNWHSPAAVVFFSDDGQTGKEASENSPNHYIEYAVVRSDAYAWKTAARHIQYESIRTSRWKSWDDWKAQNKSGVSCTVTAVRYQNYVMIRLENAGQIVSATITLPDNAPDELYFCMTGELCTMTDFILSRETEPIGPGTIQPKDYEKAFIPKEKGDIPNIDCAGWWTEHSDGIALGDKKLHITFNSISYPNSKETWHSAFVVLYSSLNQLVNGPAYREFSVTRDDGYGWKSNSDFYEVAFKQSAEFGGWDVWLIKNKKGTVCTLDVWREERNIMIELTNCGVTTTSCTVIPAAHNLPIYVALSGELCAITNIHIG